MNFRRACRRVALAGALLALAVPGRAVADVDLTVTDIELQWEGNAFRIVPTIGLDSFGDAGDLETTLDCYLDGDLAETQDFWVNAFSGGTCYGCIYPDCYGTCPDIYGIFHWYSGACNQHYPRCVCYWAVRPFVPMGDLQPFLGQSTVTVSVDPQGLIPEWDEGNNELTVPIEPPAQLDLSVDNVDVECRGDTVVVIPQIRVGAGPGGESVPFDVTVTLGGGGHVAPAYPEWQITTPCDCHTYSPPQCRGGSCFNIQWEGTYYTGVCSTAVSISPPGTFCACFWPGLPCTLRVVLGHMLDDYVTVTVDDAGAVPEWDEGNNEMTVPLGPSATENPGAGDASWSWIKNLFR